MWGGFAFSIGVHALILLLILFGLPFLQPKPRELPPMISVELVEAGKQTTTNRVSTANKVEKQARDESPAPQPKPPPEPVQPIPEPPPPQAPTPPPEPHPMIDTAIPDVAPADQAVADVETPDVDLRRPMPPAPTLDEVDSTAPELAVPQTSLRRPLAPVPDVASVETKVANIVAPAQIDLKRPLPKPPTESFDTVLKNLSKLKPQQTEPQPPEPPKAAAKPATGANAPLSDKLTASEMDALAQQLRHCWNLPAAAKDAQNMSVDVDVTVNPDRTVASAQIVDQARLSADSVFRAAAMSAVRALRMPQCTPLALPPDKYQQWQSMTLHFDPKEMLGQ